MDEERAAEGLDHLQRAAREMLAAARSFLDVVEDLVEDRAALDEVTTTLSGAASAVGDVVRKGLGARPAPWETAAWGDPPWEHVDDDGDDGDDGDTEDWAAPLADADAAPDRDGPGIDVTDRPEGPGTDRDAGGGPDPRPGSRVRRIAVD